MSHTTLNTCLDRAAIVKMVIASVQAIREMRDDGSSLPVPLDEGARLIGPEAVLDSMGLVTLIVEIEQRLEEEYNLTLILANERAMSQKHSPFRSVGSLADYICRLVERQA